MHARPIITRMRPDTNRACCDVVVTRFFLAFGPAPSPTSTTTFIVHTHTHTHTHTRTRAHFLSPTEVTRTSLQLASLHHHHHHHITTTSSSQYTTSLFPPTCPNILSQTCFADFPACVASVLPDFEYLLSVLLDFEYLLSVLLDFEYLSL